MMDKWCSLLALFQLGKVILKKFKYQGSVPRLGFNMIYVFWGTESEQCHCVSQKRIKVVEHIHALESDHLVD